jgi:hypothetical protein
MELKGKIQFEDLMAAQWLHMRPRRTMGVIGILLLGLAVLAMVGSFLHGKQSLTDPMLWILPVVLVYLALLFFVWFPRKVRRSYSQRKDFKHEISMVVTSDSLEMRTEQGYSVKPLTDYLKWKEGKNVFLLYLSDHLFHIVPKRFFAAHEDVDSFRDVIRHAIDAK